MQYRTNSSYSIDYSLQFNILSSLIHFVLQIKTNSRSKVNSNSTDDGSMRRFSTMHQQIWQWYTSICTVLREWRRCLLPWCRYLIQTPRHAAHPVESCLLQRPTQGPQTVTQKQASGSDTLRYTMPRKTNLLTRSGGYNIPMLFWKRYFDIFGNILPQLGNIWLAAYN